MNVNNFDAYPTAPPVGSDLDQEKAFLALAEEYSKAVIAAKDLEAINIQPRSKIIGDWMKEGDLGFVFGNRGSGKTWFVDFLAAGVSSGKAPTDTWEFHQAHPVLIVDGEMPYDDFKDRLFAFGGNENLHTLHHEVIFHQNGKALNLTNQKVQQAISYICDSKKIKLLILDNLSCLFNGLEENNNDAWELVLNWLLELRRKRIAVLIVHHAGRNGNMRGARRREDAAFWVIKVEEIAKRSRDEIGARFSTDFTKQRNSGNPEWGRDWAFIMAGGKLTISCQELDFKARVLRLIQDGISSATEIAAKLGVNKSTVTRAAQKLHKDRLIDNKGRNGYAPRGFMSEPATKK